MNESYERDLQEKTERQKELTEKLQRLSNQLNLASNERDQEMISNQIYEVKKLLRQINAQSEHSAKKLSMYQQLPTPEP